MIKILDTYKKIEKLLAQGSFDLSAWESYADGISKELTEMVRADIKKYDFEKQILPVMNFLFENPGITEKAHESFLKVTDNLEQRCFETFGKNVNSTVILYMGLCCAAGRAAKLCGEPVILLGIEKIAELGWEDEKNMTGLIYHELGHNWHFQNRTSDVDLETQENRALWQIYAEGVAMFFEQRLCSFPPFHRQDKNGWLLWCDENKTRLAAEYLRRVQNGESIQGFFGDWCDIEGRSDVGYYLGAKAVELIFEERGVDALLNIGAEEFKQYLKKI